MKDMNEQVLISLEVRPSFTPYFKVKLIQRGCDDNFYVRCSAGGMGVIIRLARQAAEAGRQANQNELEWERELEPEAALAVLNKLNGATVVLAAEPYRELRIGCDGTTYNLDIKQCFSTVTFNWWSTAPAGWTHLEDVVKALVELADVEAVLAPIMESRKA
jgi:hypothetical protein